MMARLYRLALRAFPTRHRDRYRAEMLDAFERQLAARRVAGGGAVARFVVAACDEWVRRFEADPNILGRYVQLGAATHQIVGVMPEGFGFPTNDTFWIPWRVDAARDQPRQGPRVGVFGRLADGATLASAQAELTEIGRRAAAESPSTHQHLRPRVMPYVYAFTDMGEPGNFLAMRAIELALVMLLIVVSVNVAILVFLDPLHCPPSAE
jgi:hypothetical protein